jgi:hypothetical protein
VNPAIEPLVRRHLILGWTYLSFFVLLGLVLETLHGFKLQWYLSVANETRRLLFTLAHAHGVLLGVLNIVFGLSIRAASATGRAVTIASPCLAIGALLLPGGFLLGGIVIHSGDPNAFILLSPLGGVLLVAGVITARHAIVGALRDATGAPSP